MIAPQTDTFVNFRGDLIRDIRKKGYKVTVVVPEDKCREFFDKNGVKVRLIDLKKNSFSVLTKTCQGLNTEQKKVQRRALQTSVQMRNCIASWRIRLMRNWII